MDFKNWLKLEERRSKLTKSQSKNRKLAAGNPTKPPVYKAELYT